jgi:hypothetical protein
VAYYRKRDLRLATTHLSKVIQLESAAEQKTPTGEWDRAICSFFLAMTYWQQDQKDKARRWYDEAAQWQRENKPDDADLLRFRAEAAELLGIELPEPAVKNAEGIDQQEAPANDINIHNK